MFQSLTILTHDRIFPDSEYTRHLRYMHIDLDLRPKWDEKFQTLFDELFLPDDSTHIVFSTSLFEIKGYRRKCSLFEICEVSSRFDIFIGVFPIWDSNDTDLEVLVHEICYRGKCRFYSCIICVECEIDDLREALEGSDMIRGEGSTTYPDGILDARLMEHDGIHLSFDDIDLSRLRDRLLREVHPIEDRALIEDM